MANVMALYDETASEEDRLEVMQEMVNDGSIWRMEGSMGRQADALLECGALMLGEKGCTDFWGNYVPSRFEVAPGTKGSQELHEQWKQENSYDL